MLDSFGNQEIRHILTIDVEDWYHSSIDLFKDTDIKHGSTPDYSVVTNTLKCLELLKQTRNTATFFILTTVCEHFPDLVKEIIKEGHEIATHGYLHKLIYKTTPQEFEYDLKKSLELLNKIGSPMVKGYRAPYWSITQQSMWALEIIAKCGLSYDSSIFPIRRKLYGIPGGITKPHRILPNLWEFPPATIRLFEQNIPIAGGGYLRLAPYKLVSRAIEKSKGDEIHVFYFHPYELDPNDTKLKHKVRSTSTLFYWLQQIIGRAANPDKIIRLLSEHNFCSLDNVLPFFKSMENDKQ